MKTFPDTMTNEVPDNTESFGLHNLLDCAGDIRETVAGICLIYTCVQGLLRGFHQVQGLL